MVRRHRLRLDHAPVLGDLTGPTPEPLGARARVGEPDPRPETANTENSQPERFVMAFDFMGYLEAGMAKGKREMAAERAGGQATALSAELRQLAADLGRLAINIRTGQTLSSPMVLEVADAGARTAISAADAFDRWPL